MFPGFIMRLLTPSLAFRILSSGRLSPRQRAPLVPSRSEESILKAREGVSNLIINPGNMTSCNVRVVLHEYEDKKTKTVYDTWGL